MACTIAGKAHLNTRRISSIGLCLVALLTTAPGWAANEPAALKTLNAVRSQGCDGRKGLATPFVLNGELTGAAREMSQGATLRDTMSHLQHRLQRTTSIVIRNAASETSRRRVLADEFCSDVLDSGLRLAGVLERGKDVWIVLGAPFATPNAAEVRAMNLRVLELINEARARKRRCGRTLYQPAGPLELAPALNKAALAHAKDMAAHSFMAHKGSDGSWPAQRATRAGYYWRTVGENVAAGSGTPEQAVRDWLESPGHCANLMNVEYTQTGIAVVFDPESAGVVYWAQVFAAPAAR
jgi:uncharacterized protein YkwD